MGKFVTICLVSLCMGWNIGCSIIRKSTIKNRSKIHEITMDPMHIGLAPDTELGLTDYDASTLFQEALRFHEAQQCPVAQKYYTRLLQEFPDSKYVSAAAYNSARCYEQQDLLEHALKLYSFITQKLRSSPDWPNAMFRKADCHLMLQQPQLALQTYQHLLQSSELSIYDRLDATVLLGQTQMQLGENLKAEQSFRQVLKTFRKHEREEYLDPAPAAQAEFRLGELARQRFINAPLRLPEEQMLRDLEDKARLLLSAQSTFVRCMRYGVPQWATAAGYQIGKLYVDLHQAMQNAPVPTDLSEEEVLVYHDVLRQRLAVLLRKALKVFEMTVQLADQTRSDNQWTQAARAEMERVEKQVLSQLEPLPTPSQPAPASDQQMPRS